MAADNKQPISNDQQTISASKVGDGGQPGGPRKLLRLPKTNKKLIALALLAILLLAGWLHFGLHVGERVYAQAAGHKVYKKDIENLIGNTKGVSNHQAATVLADKYLTEAMAKKAGIKITNQDLVAEYGPSISKQKADNPYIYQKNVNTVYFDNLSAYNTGLYKGKVLVANFSRHIAFQSPFLDIQSATDSLLGNPVAIAADKQYAKDFITQLYNQIKSGKITFDQAIQKEHDNPEVGLKAYGSLSHSGPFNTADVNLPGTSLIAPISIQRKIKNMKSGEMSAPFPVAVSNSLYNRDITTDSYYVVVRMDSMAGGHSKLTYDQYLAQAKKQLGYKINV
jgi:hypothetical protein